MTTTEKPKVSREGIVTLGGERIGRVWREREFYLAEDANGQRVALDGFSSFRRQGAVATLVERWCER